MELRIKHESDNGKEYGYGVYVNAYITDEWDNEMLYASECVAFGRNTPEAIKKAECRVRQNARRAYKRDYM